GIVAWRRDLAGLVKAGDRLGLVRVPGAPAPLAPAAAKRLAELARLAKGDPIYGEFLEKEREKLQRVRSRGQELPLAAPAAGTLRQVAADGARVSKGDRVAQLLDAAAWHLAVRLPGEPPAPDAECELAGDARDERAPCRVVEVAAPESGAVEVTVALEAKDAPWLERALSPYVRLAPAARAP
ncbi:MAG TPA: hypothetical protein VFP50_12875, partial [Anaeromyxobacteraceae bacterium]|nr:hypothetical protein [Anaeromyxobacteraceae bacterium]